MFGGSISATATNENLSGSKTGGVARQSRIVVFWRLWRKYQWKALGNVASSLRTRLAHLEGNQGGVREAAVAGERSPSVACFQSGSRRYNKSVRIQFLIVCLALLTALSLAQDSTKKGGFEQDCFGQGGRAESRGLQ